jgi:hypothetical protein
MTTKTTAAADLITETQNLVSNLEPMFYSLIKTAEHHGLDEVRISTARAREIQMDLARLKKKLKSLANTAAAAETTTERHLDKMFGIK